MNDFIQYVKENGFIGKLEMKEKFPHIIEEILLFNGNRFGDIKWGQKLFNFVNNISHPPKCVCGNKVYFYKFSRGYAIYCSSKCRYSDDGLKKKRKKTYIDGYGVDNPLKSKEVQEKRKENCIERYGVEHHSKLPDVIEKKKQTNLRKYGVATNLLHEDTINKSKKTCLERYGVEHNSQSEEIKKKKKITNLKRFGVEYNLQSKEFEEKSKKTTLQKYGVEHTSKSKEIRNKQLITRRKNRTKKIAKELDITVNDIDYVDGIYIIRNYCKKHKIFTISQNQLHQRWYKYNKNICTECDPIDKHRSIGENSIRKFIKDDLKIKTKELKINRFEIDIYLPDFNLGIEYNGLFWHSTDFKDKNFHINKTELFNKNKIDLIHVFENEWLYKNEIIKSMIKSKIGIYDKTIHSKECHIKEINGDKLVKKFLEDNHIQGFVESDIKIGLFYCNELISLIVLKKKQNEYEILRCCDKLNTQIIDSTSRILKNFIDNHNPKEILLHIDRRYSNGEEYYSLGFEKISYTEPNHKIYDKNNFRNDISIENEYNSKKSEKEMMKEKGYLCIYDCGEIILKMIPKE